MARKKAKGRPRKSIKKGDNSNSALTNATGIPPLDFQSTSAVNTRKQNRVGEIITPTVNEENLNRTGGQSQGNRTWASLFPVDGMNLNNGCSMNNGEQNNENVKITFEDIRSEVEYWSSVVLCRVLGANPSLQVMDGFFRRVWGKIGIDNIALVANGIFIVRFNSIEGRTKVVEDGCPMFDIKPVIVRGWEADLDVKQIDTSRDPVW